MDLVPTGSLRASFEPSQLGLEHSHTRHYNPRMVHPYVLSSVGHGGLMAAVISQFGQDWKKGRKEDSFPSHRDDVRHDATPFINHGHED